MDEFSHKFMHKMKNSNFLPFVLVQIHFYVPSKKENKSTIFSVSYRESLEEQAGTAADVTSLSSDIDALYSPSRTYSSQNLNLGLG